MRIFCNWVLVGEAGGHGEGNSEVHGLEFEWEVEPGLDDARDERPRRSHVHDEVDTALLGTAEDFLVEEAPYAVDQGLAGHPIK